MPWPQEPDPLAGYTPDWRKQLGLAADPLADYTPDWRQMIGENPGQPGLLRHSAPALELTAIPTEREPDFRDWVQRNQIQDLDHPDSHYDYRGAFMAGVDRDPVSGHWPDQWKQHGETTFSDQSQYSRGPGDGGTWEGEVFTPPPAEDPLASYTPDWRSRLVEPPIRESGLSPAQREAAAAAPSSYWQQTGPEHPAARFAEGLATGFAKGIVSPITAAREAGSAIFTGPTEEEAADPLLRASRLARYGQVPPMEPVPEGTPGPAALAGGLVSSLVTAPIEAGKELLRNPNPKAKGEAAAGLILTALMARQGYKAGRNAYRGAEERAYTRQGEEAPANAMTEPGTAPPSRPVASDIELGGPATRPEPVSRVPTAPAVPDGPTIIDRNTMRQQYDPGTGLDLGAAQRGVEDQVRQALGEGREVTLHIEGKPRRIIQVAGGLRDEAGQPWGIQPLLQPLPGDPARIEIGPRPGASITLPTTPDGGALPPGRPGTPEPIPPRQPEPLPQAQAPATPHQLGPAVEGPAGADTNVLLADNTPLPARYRVIEADQLRSSHDPFTFQPTEGYPAGVQGRDYQRNRGAQETAQARGLDFNPDLALNRSLTAGEGQPVILPDGTVLIGNERSMHPRLAAELAPDRYDAYRQALAQNAPDFGLDSAQVAGMRRPVLVRELTSEADIMGGTRRWAEINRLSDQVTTKRKSTVEEGAARAQALGQADDALQHFSATIGPDQSIGEYLGTTEGHGFVSLLLRRGVISKEELGRYTSGGGAITLDGRAAIREMLLSTAVRDPAVLLDAPASMVGKLEHAIPGIVSLRGTAWDPATIVTEALRLAAEAKKKGLSLRDLAGQGDFLATGGGVPELVQDFAAYLDQTPKARIAEAFRRFAALGREALSAEGSVDMFGGTGFNPAAAFRDAFGLKGTFQVMQGGGRRKLSPNERARQDELSLFGGVERQGDLLGADQGPTRMGETGVGQRAPEGGISGLLAARRRAAEVLADPREQYQAQQGSPSPQYAEARALLARGETIDATEVAQRQGGLSGEAPASPTINQPGQGDIFSVGMGAGKERKPFIRELLEGRQRTPRAVPTPESGLPSPAEPSQYPGPIERTKAIIRSVREIAAPATVSDVATAMADVISWKNAERAHDIVIAERGLRDASKYADRLSIESQMALDEAIESGAKVGDPQLASYIELFRDLLDTEARKIQALGTGKLKHLIENYLPHIWSDPEAAARTIGQMNAKRPFKGNQSFTKQRTVPTMREGIAMGLVPVTYNPFELALIKYREMRRYRMATEIMQHESRSRRLRFVGSDEQPPTGYRKIEDPAFSVFGPPTVKIKEGFDAMVREKLQAVIASIPGLEHIRKPNIGRRSALGYAEGPAGKKMATKFGTESVVIEHELGHILDFRYGLWERIVKPAAREARTLTKGKRKGQTVTQAVKERAERVAERKQIKEELRALADLRFEGKEAEVTPHFKRYTRDKYEQMANAIHALIYAPEKMQQVAPTVKARLSTFFQSDPKLQPILDIKPSLRIGTATATQDLPGFPLLGQYYAESPVARVLNNFLSPGLRGNALFDAYMGVGNTLNQAQLGLSAFHAGFTSVDTATSKLALSIEQLRAGRFKASAKSAVQFPVAAFSTAFKGSRLKAEYLRPGSHPEYAHLAHAMDLGGGRAFMEGYYKNNSIHAMIGAFRARAYGHATMYFIPALVELTAKPIMEGLVPLQKMGVFADLASFELSRLPKDATPELIRRRMRLVWDSVDNRLGQMVYDNLYWHHAAKDMLMATVRSVGWNTGTIRELGGGAFDLARGKLTHRGAYLIALPMAVGFLGGVIHYLYNGKGPETLKDYFYPRTGRLDDDGNEERVQLPSYLKDITAVGHHPVQTSLHKLHPFISTVSDMLMNENFYGNQIRNPHDPLVRQFIQEAEYVGKEFLPFGVRNVLRDKGQSLTTKVANFVGITPAPREAVRTPAQNYTSEVLSKRGGRGATPEEVEERNRARGVKQGYRSGDLSREEVTDSMRAGALTRRQRDQLVRTKGTPPSVARFKQLGWEDAERAYALADDRERFLWWPMLKRKRVAAYQNMARSGVNDERRAALLRAIRAEGRAEAPGEPLTAGAR